MREISAAERADQRDLCQQTAAFEVGHRTAAGDERIFGGQRDQLVAQPAGVAQPGDPRGIGIGDGAAALFGELRVHAVERRDRVR